MTDSSPSPSPAPSSRRRLVLILAVALVIVLVAAGVVGTRILGVWGDEPEPQATASPSPEVPSPFAGTPAEDFPEGADGVVLPPAEPVGDFTAEQVADALEQVRAALIAARLDSSMLVEHDPDGFLAVLARDLRPVLDQAFQSEESGAFATQVAEDAPLVPAPPRVMGTMSFEATTAERDLPVIKVTTRFAWVYAFGPTDSQVDGDLAVIRDELVWQLALGDPWTETSQGLWLVEQASRAWGADCDAYEDGVLHPDDEPIASLVEGADVIFDAQQPLDVAAGC
jgi:hypothetical protein